MHAAHCVDSSRWAAGATRVPRRIQAPRGPLRYSPARTAKRRCRADLHNTHTNTRTHAQSSASHDDAFVRGPRPGSLSARRRWSGVAHGYTADSDPPSCGSRCRTSGCQRRAGGGGARSARHSTPGWSAWTRSGVVAQRRRRVDGNGQLLSRRMSGNVEFMEMTC